MVLLRDRRRQGPQRRHLREVSRKKHFCGDWHGGQKRVSLPIIAFLVSKQTEAYLNGFSHSTKNYFFLFIMVSPLWMVLSAKCAVLCTRYIQVHKWYTSGIWKSNTGWGFFATVVLCNQLPCFSQHRRNLARSDEALLPPLPVH